MRMSEACWADVKHWGFQSVPCALTHCPGVDLPLRGIYHMYLTATIAPFCTHEKVNAEVPGDVPRHFNPVPMASVSFSPRKPCYDHCYFNRLLYGDSLFSPL